MCRRGRGVVVVVQRPGKGERAVPSEQGWWWGSTKTRCLLAHWSADRGIGDLASSWEPGGALALSWGLATEPRAGTTYRVTVAESSGGRLLEREAGVFGLRWSGAVPVESGRTLLWRVEAIDAEGSVYAAGHAETEPAP